MKLADVLGALRRRWYVLVVGILVAGAAAYGVWSYVPPEYERTATQLLLPGEATIPEDANPYLFVGGLYQVADILVRAIGPDDLAAVTDAYPGTEVTVSRDTAAGSVMIVSVTAPSDTAAQRVLGDMLELTGSKLVALQDEQQIPADERIDMVPLTQATDSVVIQKDRMTFTAVTAIGLVALTGVLAVLLDTLLRLRRRARSGARSEAEDLAAAEDAAGDEDAVGDRPAGVGDSQHDRILWAADAEEESVPEDIPDPSVVLETPSSAPAPQAADEADSTSPPPAESSGDDDPRADGADDPDTDPDGPGGGVARRTPAKAGTGGSGGSPRPKRTGRPAGRRRNWQAAHPADTAAMIARAAAPDIDRQAG